MTPSLMKFDAMVVLARSKPDEFEKLTVLLCLEAASSFRSLEHGEKSLLELQIVLSKIDSYEDRRTMLLEKLSKMLSQLQVLIGPSQT